MAIVLWGLPVTLYHMTFYYFYIIYIGEGIRYRKISGLLKM